MTHATKTYKTGFAHRIVQAITNALRRERARHQTTAELSRLDSHTLKDLGLTAANMPREVSRRRAMTGQDTEVSLGNLVREMDGPAAPLHPITAEPATRHSYVNEPAAFITDRINARRLRTAAANRNAVTGKVAAA